MARIQWTGGTQQFAFEPDARETRVSIAEPPRAARGAGSFFPLGIKHIVTGYDHLLFLLALILRGGGLIQLLKIITGFTVAHSITLALAVLNVVILPDRLVEAVIALSIAYVAAENLFPRYAASRRWTVSFLFGLMHGFGFSSVLRDIAACRRKTWFGRCSISILGSRPARQLQCYWRCPCCCGCAGGAGNRKSSSACPWWCLP